MAEGETKEGEPMLMIDTAATAAPRVTVYPLGARGAKPIRPAVPLEQPPLAGPELDAKPAPDYGPEIRQEQVRGRVAGYVKTQAGLVVRDKRGRPKQRIVTLRVPHVVREDRPDPENPNATVRGARRRDGLMMMFRKGQLSPAQAAAADAFRDDLAITAGARLSLPHEAPSTRARRTDFHPSMRQIDAQTRCKGAWAALTPLQRPIVTWVVISWGTVGGYAQCARIRPSRASDRLLEALDRLADFYTAQSEVDAGQRNGAKKL